MNIMVFKRTKTPLCTVHECRDLRNELKVLHLCRHDVRDEIKKMCEEMRGA